MYAMHSPITAAGINVSEVTANGDRTSAMTTLPSLSWLGHNFTSEILALRAKALFDYANDKC